MDSDPPKEVFDADPTGEVPPVGEASDVDPADQDISRELSELAESLDATLGEANESAEEKPASSTDDSDLLLDDAAIEELLNSVEAGEDLPGDTKAEDPLSSEGMDDSLVEAESGGAEDAEETPVTVEDSTPPPEASDPPTTEAEETVAEQVGSENVAAGAAEEGGADLLSQDLLDQLLKEAESAEEEETAEAPQENEESTQEKAPPAAETPQPEGIPETAEEADTEPPEDSTTKERRSAAIIAFALAHPARIAATLAAGLAFGVGVFLFLITNQLRDVSSGGDVARNQGQLKSATDYARALLDSGDAPKARNTLEKALEGVSPGIEVATASFLLIEARVQALPAKVSDRRADPIHEEIDHLVERSQGDPRVPQALYSKAKLYAASGNPIAARGVLQRLMREHADAERIDLIYFEAGRLALDMGRPEDAAEHFQSLLVESPASPLVPEAGLLRGDALALLGREDEAERIFRRATQTPGDPRVSAKAFERLGKLALDAGRYGEAIDVLETRLETATSIEGNDTIYLLLAEALRKAGDLEEARTLLNELIEFFPESDAIPSAYIDLSQVLRELGRSGDALRFATQAVQRYPDNSDVLRNEGEMLAESGDARAAGRALIAADRAGGEDPELLLAAARQFENSADWQRARETYVRIAERFPDAPQAIEGTIGAARMLYESGQIGPALAEAEDLAEATEGRQHQLPVLLALGELYRDLGLKAAVADIYGRVASSTTDPGILADAAIALLAADAWDEGLAVASRADLDALSSAEAYALLLTQGETLMRVNSDEALRKMEQAYEAYPDERTSLGDQLYLRANLAAGRTARARVIVEDLQRRVEQHQIDPERLNSAAVAWGDFLFERNDFRAASDAYRKALQSAHLRDDGSGDSVASLSDTQHWALYQRANALMKMSRYEDCIELYEQLDSANSPWSSEAKARAAAARLELRLRGGAGSRRST